MKIKFRNIQWLSDCECSITCDVEYWTWNFWNHPLPQEVVKHFIEYHGSHGVWHRWYGFHVADERPPKKVERALSKIFDRELQKKLRN